MVDFIVAKTDLLVLFQLNVFSIDETKYQGDENKRNIYIRPEIM